jgi:uncharacterized LabA/DUF88 family protein
MPSAQRVCVYFDGFNLYHALLLFRDPKVEWLNLMAICARLMLSRSEKIESVYYFSAYATWLPSPMARHEEYVRALEAVGIIPVMGHFKEKDRECKRNHGGCGRRWTAHEEKETDVSIGVTLLRDAYQDRYDRALLVTRDSDLMPAVKMVRHEFPKKEIVAVAPPMMGHSNDLLGVVNSKRKITPKMVRSCLFPKLVHDAAGILRATRPAKYD